MNENGSGRPSMVYLKVTADGEVQQAVAYLRVSALGAERAAALIAQRDALQRFADDAGYKVVRWYEEGQGVELEGSVLDQLLEDVVSEGREFNAVLVWNWSRLSRDRFRMVQIERTLRAHGMDLVSVNRESSARRLGAAVG